MMWEVRISSSCITKGEKHWRGRHRQRRREVGRDAFSFYHKYWLELFLTFTLISKPQRTAVGSRKTCVEPSTLKAVRHRTSAPYTSIYWQKFQVLSLLIRATATGGHKMRPLTLTKPEMAAASRLTDKDMVVKPSLVTLPWFKAEPTLCKLSSSPFLFIMLAMTKLWGVFLLL